jgi:hypothetical protein
MIKLIIIFFLVINYLLNKYYKLNSKIENYKKSLKNQIYDNFTLLDWDKVEDEKIIINEEDRKYIYYVLFSESNPDIKKWEKDNITNLNKIIHNLVKVIGPKKIERKSLNYKDYERGIYKRVRFILINYYDCSLINLEKLASGNILMKNFIEIKRNCIFDLFKKYIPLCIPLKIFTDRLNINSLVHLLLNEYYMGKYLKSYGNESVYLYNIHIFEKSNYIIVDSLENNELMLQLSRCLKKSAKKVIYKLFPNTTFYSNYENTVESLHYFLNNEEGLKYFNINNNLSKKILLVK